MRPGDIRFATHSFSAPKGWDEAKNGECDTLTVRRRNETGNHTFESAWYPTPEELALLNAGEPVILTVWNSQPPVSINVNEGEKSP